MGKKNKTTGLGKSLIRDRFGKHSHDRAGGDTFLHTSALNDGYEWGRLNLQSVTEQNNLEDILSTAELALKQDKFQYSCLLHTSALNDGYEWGRLNLQSVTEQNNLEDFLSTAELAGTEFAAEKMNIKVIQKDVHGGLPHGEELARIQNLQKQHKDSIRIPRRPHWDKEMSASEVDQNEKAAFLEWRRSLALLQEVDGLVLTPYEKNLDFWRQLWRVIERSDVVVQIVDARNPLLFYCPDLESYVHEKDPNKVSVVLVNKADFLTQQQREAWADYFNKQNVRVAFWSAVDETKRQEEAAKSGTESLYSDEIDEGVETDSDNCEDDDIDPISEPISDKQDKLINETTADCDDMKDATNKTQGNSESMDTGVLVGESNSDLETNKMICDVDDVKHGDLSDTAESEMDAKNNLDVKCGSDAKVDHSNSGFVNSVHVFTGPELLDYLRSLHRNLKLTTVGMVGYPNVGKSSTINAILKMKKVPVSATPGRTKHFQTLYVDKDLMLCDCPGLVFPSFVTTKADLVVSGILPIDQMRDHVPPTALICQLIPRHLLEKVYGIIISKPKEGEDPNRPPTAEEFLNAYGAMRGFMTSRGLPDCPRSSRYVLKDYVNGKLLYCHPPPGTNTEDFNVYSENSDITTTKQPTSCEIIPESSAIDREFFEKKISTSHTRTAGSGSVQMGVNSASEKPWRKHNNKRKKEKLRKTYGYLDKH